VNEFVTVKQDPPKVLKEHSAALMIGDAALFFESADWFYKYDLAELWREWTGEPFVFSLWMVRKKIATEASGTIADFIEILRANLRKNLAEPEKLIEQALGMTPSDKLFAQTLGFLVNLRYEIDARMVTGLLKFYEFASEEGFAPEAKALEYFSAGNAA